MVRDVWYTGAMTQYKRISTHKVETGRGYTLTLTVEGFVDEESESYLSELLGVAGSAFGDVFSSSFEEGVAEQIRHVYERIAAEESKPDRWSAGYDAGVEAAGATVAAETEPALKVGDTVRITGATRPKHAFEVGDEVTLIAEPDGNPRSGGQRYEDSWDVEGPTGLTQWVHPDDFERVSE